MTSSKLTCLSVLAFAFALPLGCSESQVADDLTEQDAAAFESGDEPFQLYFEDAQTGADATLSESGARDQGAPRADSGVDAGGDAGGTSVDPEIANIVSQVDATRVMDRVNTLSNFTTRNTCSDDTPSGNAIGAARDWIKGQFETAPDLVVSLDEFTYAGCPNGSVQRENVVAVKMGSNPGRVVVIGGHYDSRTYNVTDGKGVSPGANDSGSQTSLVLEAAHVLSGHTFDATLLFVAFAGEEQGLLGSANLAKSYAQYVSPGAKVEVMLNADIVGGDSTMNDATTLQQFRLYAPGTPREIKTTIGTTDDTSPSRGLMRFIARSADLYVSEMAMVPELREDRPGRGGDHESFLDSAYPAVRFIETVESPNSGQPGSHQHSPDDLPMYVTPGYAARVSEVVIATAASLARAPQKPALTAVTLPANGPLTLNWTAPPAGPAVHHYAVAARPATANFYGARVALDANATSGTVSSSALGVDGGAAFFVSIAAVDAAGHESLFAYPEYRCDTSGCVVPAGALNVTVKQ